jgi:hypothetical protein
VSRLAAWERPSLVRQVQRVTPAAFSLLMIPGASLHPLGEHQKQFAGTQSLKEPRAMRESHHPYRGYRRHAPSQVGAHLRMLACVQREQQRDRKER